MSQRYVRFGFKRSASCVALLCAGAALWQPHLALAEAPAAANAAPVAAQAEPASPPAAAPAPEPGTATAVPAPTQSDAAASAAPIHPAAPPATRSVVALKIATEKAFYPRIDTAKAADLKSHDAFHLQWQLYFY